LRTGSAGDFLLLANRYRSDNRPEYATASYRLAGTIATSAQIYPIPCAPTRSSWHEGLAGLKEFGLAQLYWIAIISRR
jgi:hypothetical protein